MRCNHRTLVAIGLAVLALAPIRALADSYDATYLVSNIPGMAQITDPLLTNPWGITYLPTGPFWVANEGSDSSTVYSGDVNGSPFMKSPTEVTIPGGRPTGIVSNSGSAFAGARFIFAALNGTINSWSSGSQAVLRATVPGAFYTGLAIGTDSASNNRLYAANVTAGTIDVFDTNYQQVDTGGAFSDPDLPPGFAPFNVQRIHANILVVTYVNTQDRDHGGVINGFDTDGNLLGRFAEGGSLNAPWGLALAPAGFGQFSHALLVGNFGDGHISAFNPHTGEFLGLLLDANGNPWYFERLWGLTFGNGVSAGDHTTLYFAAGINHQHDGLFGSLKLGSGGAP
jgi:uncharacterized protein (TIGR03118 family)